MSNDQYSDSGFSASGEVKGEARQQAGEVTDHAAREAGAVKDHAAQEADQVKDHAAQEAGQVKDHAVGAARDVAATAQTEARSVARDARTEVRGLVDTGLNELNTQMGGGQARLASELRTVVDEIGEMAGATEQDGIATQVARELNQRGNDLVGWMESHEPRDAVDQVRRYAARNSWTFLAIAAGAGLIVGRFARGLRDDNADDDESTFGGYSGQSGYGRAADDQVYSGQTYSDQTYSDQTGVGRGYAEPARPVYGTESGAVGVRGYAGTTEGLGYPGTEATDVAGYRPGAAGQGYNAQFGEGQFGNPGEGR